MRIYTNIEKKDRKQMAADLAERLGLETEYLGVPSCAYKVGEAVIGKDCSIEFPDGYDEDGLLEALADLGIEFIPEAPEDTEEGETETEEAEEQDSLSIQVPRASLSDEAIDNIEKIVESKGELLKHAFGVSDLPLAVDDEKVTFDWFRLEDAESAQTYTKFVTAICDMAKNQKRITAKPRENENEKYAFRCFLLRLGFIGAEYKNDRRILLKNLSGSAAFPTKVAAEEFAARQKAKRDAEKAARQEVAE